MNVLLAVLLSTAMSAAADGAARTPSDDTREQAPKADTQAEQASAKAERDDDPGMRTEIDKLLELQGKIRALLDATPPSTSPEIQPEHTGPTGDTDISEPANVPSQPPAALDAMAAADAFYLLGDYNEALALYGQVAADTADDSCWAILQKASCLRWLGRLTEAVNMYQQILTEYPDNPWVAEAEWWIVAVQWKIDLRENSL